MAETARSTNPKRSICPSCSKAARKCLSARIRSPGLDHPVPRHRPPAQPGAEAPSQFHSNLEAGPQERRCRRRFRRQLRRLSSRSSGLVSGVMVGNPNSVVESNGAHCPGDDRDCGSIAPNGGEVSEDSQVPQNSRACGVLSRSTSKPVISFRMGKKGIIGSIDHVWMSRIGHQGADFDAISDCPSAHDVMSNGFVVRKSQNLVSNLSLELEEFEEFVLEVPHGSVLLFPTENALSIDELKAAEFKVRNLIVLDGTWMKAKRMYSENCWLKLLPCL